MKPGLKNKDFIVIQDTREQIPWDFSYFDGFSGLEKKKLVAGDYTLFGHEQYLSIERKKTTGEIAINLGRKLKQFENELMLLQYFKYKYIICEFTLDDIYRFPVNSGIPVNKHKYLRISGNYILMQLNKLVNKYNVELIFSGNKSNAENAAYEIFQRIINV